MRRLMHVLRGLGVEPKVTGAARGLLEAVALAAIAGAYLYVSAEIVPQLPEVLVAPVLAGAGFVVRTLEGMADQIDPAKQRRTAGEIARPVRVLGRNDDHR